MAAINRMTRDKLKKLGAVEHLVPKHKLGVVEWDDPAQLSQAVYDKVQEMDSSGRYDSWYLGSDLKNLADNQRAVALGAVPQRLFDKYCEARDSLQPLIDEFISLGVSTKRRRVRRETGAELDIDRLMVHDPCCWESRERGAKKQRIVLGVQYGYVAGAGEQVFIRNAAAATAASDVLERLGYAVEIVGVSWGTLHDRRGGAYDDWFMVNVVRLKRSEEPLDPQSILITGLPAMSRVFEFGVWDAYSSNWGMSLPSLTDKHRKALGIDAFIGEKWMVDPNGSISHSQELDNFFNTMSQAVLR